MQTYEYNSQSFAEWITDKQIASVSPDVKGDPILDKYMVDELKKIQTQGRLTAGNNEWVFVADMVNGSLTSVGLRQGSEFEASPPYEQATGELKAVGHSHPASSAGTDQSVQQSMRRIYRDLENACRELPGSGDHKVPMSISVPNYVLTPTGNVRVVEIIKGKVQVRTVSGTDYSGSSIMASSYPEASGLIGQGAYNVPQQSDFVIGKIPPCFRH